MQIDFNYPKDDPKQVELLLKEIKKEVLPLQYKRINALAAALENAGLEMGRPSLVHNESSLKKLLEDREKLKFICDAEGENKIGKQARKLLTKIEFELAEPEIKNSNQVDAKRKGNFAGLNAVVRRSFKSIRNTFRSIGTFIGNIPRVVRSKIERLSFPSIAEAFRSIGLFFKNLHATTSSQKGTLSYSELINKADIIKDYAEKRIDAKIAVLFYKDSEGKDQKLIDLTVPPDGTAEGVAQKLMEDLQEYLTLDPEAQLKFRDHPLSKEEDRIMLQHFAREATLQPEETKAALELLISMKQAGKNNEFFIDKVMQKALQKMNSNLEIEDMGGHLVAKIATGSGIDVDRLKLLLSHPDVAKHAQLKKYILARSEALQIEYIRKTQLSLVNILKPGCAKDLTAAIYALQKDQCNVTHLNGIEGMRMIASTLENNDFPDDEAIEALVSGLKPVFKNLYQSNLEDIGKAKIKLDAIQALDEEKATKKRIETLKIDFKRASSENKMLRASIGNLKLEAFNLSKQIKNLDPNLQADTVSNLPTKLNKTNDDIASLEIQKNQTSEEIERLNKLLRAEIDMILVRNPQVIVFWKSLSMGLDDLLDNLQKYEGGELYLYRGMQQWSRAFPKDKEFRDINPKKPGSEDPPDFAYNENSWIAMSPSGPTSLQVALSWSEQYAEFFRNGGGIDATKPVALVFKKVAGPPIPVAFCMDGEIQMKGPIKADEIQTIMIDDDLSSLSGGAKDKARTFRDIAEENNVPIKGSKKVTQKPQ